MVTLTPSERRLVCEVAKPRSSRSRGDFTDIPGRHPTYLINDGDAALVDTRDPRYFRDAQP
jgi:hypothetical protein